MTPQVYKLGGQWWIDPLGTLEGNVRELMAAAHGPFLNKESARRYAVLFSDALEKPK